MGLGGGGELDEEDDLGDRSPAGGMDDSVRLGTAERLDTGGGPRSLGPEDNTTETEEEEEERIEPALERIAGERGPNRLSSSSSANVAGDEGKGGKSRTGTDDTALLESSATDTAGEERRVTKGGKAGSKGVGGKDRSDGVTEGGRGIFWACSEGLPPELARDLIVGTRDGTPTSDCSSSSDNLNDDKRGVLSSEDTSEGIAGAVTYSEAGAGTDNTTDSVEEALEGSRAEP
jgi:hypothetical protein